MLLLEEKHITPTVGDRHDRDIEAQAERLLKHTSQLRGRPVFCRFENGTLRLRGRVDSYYMKQIAQTVVRDVDGVEQIVNDLMVAPRPASPVAGAH